MVRFLRSHIATVLSADPVASIYSLNGLNARQLTSAECASIICCALDELLPRVSQLKQVRKADEILGHRVGVNSHHQLLVVTD